MFSSSIHFGTWAVSVSWSRKSATHRDSRAGDRGGVALGLGSVPRRPLSRVSSLAAEVAAGAVPHDDWEMAYHRNLTGRINAPYGEAVKTWADRIVDYVGRRDQQTSELAKYLDQLARKGIDAERLLDLAAARKPMPIDHPTAALAYRVKDLAIPLRQRLAVPSIDPFPRQSQTQSGPSLGL